MTWETKAWESDLPGPGSGPRHLQAVISPPGYRFPPLGMVLERMKSWKRDVSQAGANATSFSPLSLKCGRIIPEREGLDGRLSARRRKAQSEDTECIVIHFKCYKRRIRKQDSQRQALLTCRAGDAAPFGSAELRAESLEGREVHGTHS